MKKLTAILLALVLCLSCVSAFAAEKISIIATPSPHAEVLELIKDDMAALGYELEIQVVTDYVVENPATAAGDVDANYFQHIPYLNQYNATAADAEKLVAVIYTHFEPLAIYAGTKDDLAKLEKGDKIVIPNDPSNETRALLLLQEAGLIKLPADTTLESQITVEDIAENANELQIVEANAELIPGLRDDAAFAVINGNNASLAGLNPVTDGLFYESAESQAAKAYVNLIAVKPENADADWVKALESCVYTQKVYDLILSRGFVPTFEVKAE
jgi:D-methionine transport system substrate-binding protein